MLQDDSVSLQEGDMYHGRYRILRCIEADGTGAAYEAVDTTTNARQILRVVSSGTVTGTGIHVQSSSDRSIAENIAFLSEASFEQTAKSVYSGTDDDDDDDDDDANAVTQICESRLPEPVPLPSTEAPPAPRPVPIPLPPPPPLIYPDVTLRATLPAIPLLPSDGLSLGVYNQSAVWDERRRLRPDAPNTKPAPLPPPTPPPERALRPVLPLPPPIVAPEVMAEVTIDAQAMQMPLRPKRVTPVRIVVAVIALLVGSLGYLLVNRDKPEPPPSQSTPPVIRIGSAPPSEPPNAASEANGQGVDAKAATNPSEADRHRQDPNPLQTPPSKATKSSTENGSTPTSKRRRETLY